MNSDVIMEDVYRKIGAAIRKTTAKICRTSKIAHRIHQVGTYIADAMKIPENSIRRN